MKKNPKTHNASGLLKDKRFFPFFATQFLGAFNDNVFKNALVILITFKAATLGALTSEQMVALCGGLFILPFFLFSALAGQLADKYSKSKLIVWIKVLEIFIMAVGALGFILQSIPLLLLTLFVMGLQSTFFGPAKYSILPELLDQEELVTGTAYIEMGTFVSILLGTILGGVLVSLPLSAHWPIGVTVIALAALGTFSASKIQPLPAANKELKVNYNPFVPTWEILKLTKKERSVFLSILGISWFWAIGAAFLSLLPPYAKDFLGANESLVTFFLALFSVGVGLGSMICEKLSFRKLELGLVPLGSLGITLFIFDLFLVGRPDFVQAEQIMGVKELLSHRDGIRITVDLLLFSMTSGLFIVPLYTLIQERSETSIRSRIVAGNNILNSLFMVVAAVGLMGLFALGLSIPQIFLIIAIINLLVAIYIYTILPEFLFRFLCWCLAHILYNLKVKGGENIPEEGPAVLVCNHVSFVDWMIVASSTQRPIRFVMHHSFMKIPLLNKIFRDVKVIPIAGGREDKDLMEEAFRQIAHELKAGELVCIFPEGKITYDGLMNAFRPGIERIVKETPVPVIPMHLHGLWGSIFSRKDGPALAKFPRRIFFPVQLNIGEAKTPQEATASNLQEAVSSLSPEHAVNLLGTQENKA